MQRLQEKAADDLRAGEHYIIGITVDCGNGGCILKQVQGKDRECIDGTRFDNGDYAVAMRWLTRLDEDLDPEQRTFELDPCSQIFTINSSELRWNNIELDRVLPAEPQVRRSGRGMTRAQSNRGIVLPNKYTIYLIWAPPRPLPDYIHLRRMDSNQFITCRRIPSPVEKNMKREKDLMETLSQDVTALALTSLIATSILIQ